MPSPPPDLLEEDDDDDDDDELPLLLWDFSTLPSSSAEAGAAATRRIARLASAPTKTDRATPVHVQFRLPTLARASALI